MVINQHYVPQVYLRNFATKFKEDVYRLFVYDKHIDEVRKDQNVKGYASERYFYDVDLEELARIAKSEGNEIPTEIEQEIKNIDKQYIENFFSEVVEGKLFSYINNIIAAYNLTPKKNFYKSEVISRESREAISYYLAYQFMRTKEFRETYAQVQIRLIEKLHQLTMNKDNFNDLINNYRIEIPKYLLKLYHANMMMDREVVDEWAQLFFNYIWLIGVNTSDVPLYTSDAPICHFGWLGKNGFGSEGVEVVFPISSNLILIMRERTYHIHSIINENKFILINENDVRRFNILQTQNAYRYVFSKYNELESARKYRKMNPEIGDKDRKRIWVNL